MKTYKINGSVVDLVTVTIILFNILNKVVENYSVLTPNPFDKEKYFD